MFLYKGLVDLDQTAYTVGDGMRRWFIQAIVRRSGRGMRRKLPSLVDGPYAQHSGWPVCLQACGLLELVGGHSRYRDPNLIPHNLHWVSEQWFVNAIF